MRSDFMPPSMRGASGLLAFGDDVDAGIARCNESRQLSAGGVVCVQVHWKVKSFAKRRDQFLGGGGAK